MLSSLSPLVICNGEQRERSEQREIVIGQDSNKQEKKQEEEEQRAKEQTSDCSRLLDFSYKMVLLLV